MLKIILPLVFTLLLPIFNKKYSWIYSIVIFLGLRIILLIKFQPSNYKFELTHNYLFIDALSIPIITLTIWISRLIVLARYKILISTTSPRFYLTLTTILSLILTLTFSSSNLLIFYMRFEAALIPTLFIILIWGIQPERLQAASYFILYTVSASLPLLLRLIIIYNINSTLSIFLNFWNAPIDSSIFKYWWFITILAFLVKIPIYTTHLWLPKAHVEAPVAGSMVLAAILLKLGRYGLLRLSIIYPFINLQLLPVIASISIIGALITGLICSRQHDIKALIAYASVSHIGLLISRRMTSSIWGWQGNLAIIISHGICSSAIFATINIIYETSNSRRLFIIKGLITITPRYTIWLFLILIANIAAPPSINLITEIILIATVSSTSTKLMILFAFSAFLSAVYSLYLFSATQHGIFPRHLNPVIHLSNRNTLILLLHTFPLFFISTRIDLITLWC